MLWLMIGRVDGAEGNDADKLEKYRRAFGIANRRALDGEDRCELLSRIFELEVEFEQHAAAQRTFALLRKEPAGAQEIADGIEAAARVDAALASNEPVSATATIYNPCDCETGEPLWSYVPARQTFSFADLNGNVERFEARCDDERFKSRVEADKTWSLPSGKCRVFVFGDDGANFQFVEHGGAGPGLGPAEGVVARSHVLDR